MDEHQAAEELSKHLIAQIRWVAVMWSHHIEKRIALAEAEKPEVSRDIYLTAKLAFTRSETALHNELAILGKAVFDYAMNEKKLVFSPFWRLVKLIAGWRIKLNYFETRKK